MDYGRNGPRLVCFALGNIGSVLSVVHPFAAVEPGTLLGVGIVVLVEQLIEAFHLRFKLFGGFIAVFLIHGIFLSW